MSQYNYIYSTDSAYGGTPAFPRKLPDIPGVSPGSTIFKIIPFQDRALKHLFVMIRSGFRVVGSVTRYKYNLYLYPDFDLDSNNYNIVSSINTEGVDGGEDYPKYCFDTLYDEDGTASRWKLFSMNSETVVPVEVLFANKNRESGWATINYRRKLLVREKLYIVCFDWLDGTILVELSDFVTNRKSDPFLNVSENFTLNDFNPIPRVTYNTGDGTATQRTLDTQLVNINVDANEYPSYKFRAKTANSMITAEDYRFQNNNDIIVVNQKINRYGNKFGGNQAKRYRLSDLEVDQLEEENTNIGFTSKFRINKNSGVFARNILSYVTENQDLITNNFVCNVNTGHTIFRKEDIIPKIQQVSANYENSLLPLINSRMPYLKRKYGIVIKEEDKSKVTTITEITYSGFYRVFVKEFLGNNIFQSNFYNRFSPDIIYRNQTASGNPTSPLIVARNSYLDSDTLLRISGSQEDHGFPISRPISGIISPLNYDWNYYHYIGIFENLLRYNRIVSHHVKDLGTYSTPQAELGLVIKGPIYTNNSHFTFTSLQDIIRVQECSPEDTDSILESKMQTLSNIYIESADQRGVTIGYTRSENNINQVYLNVEDYIKDNPAKNLSVSDFESPNGSSTVTYGSSYIVGDSYFSNEYTISDYFLKSKLNNTIDSILGTSASEFVSRKAGFISYNRRYSKEELYDETKTVCSGGYYRIRDGLSSRTPSSSELQNYWRTGAISRGEIIYVPQSCTNPVIGNRTKAIKYPKTDMYFIDNSEDKSFPTSLSENVTIPFVYVDYIDSKREDPNSKYFRIAIPSLFSTEAKLPTDSSLYFKFICQESYIEKDGEKAIITNLICNSVGDIGNKYLSIPSNLRSGILDIYLDMEQGAALKGLQLYAVCKFSEGNNTNLYRLSYQ